MQRQLGDEAQGGVAADPAFEESRGGGGPGDSVLLLIPVMRAMPWLLWPQTRKAEVALVIWGRGNPPYLVA